jgi:hypothetical protein
MAIGIKPDKKRANSRPWRRDERAEVKPPYYAAQVNKFINHPQIIVA